ncbi:MAG: hypothetical protein LBC41_13745 [Clostridiales bacterium]|jgi:hypothetical protein|nr:hypothetical protein [Clostridiales bacterium]MDR2751716.1 hypothetical protein [Clostridiales bacterium]
MIGNGKIIDFNYPFAKLGKEKYNLVVNDPDFDLDEVGKLIVKEIVGLKPVGISNCIKSYICMREEENFICMSGDCNFDARSENCKKVILASFKKTGTPYSFEPSAIKPSQHVNNWLKQSSVSRDTVFLMSFALQSSPEETSSFLKDGLGKRDFFFMDHHEAFVCYCLRKGLSASDVIRLEKIFDSSPGTYNGTKVSEEKFRDASMRVDDEQSLMDLHLTLKGGPARDSNDTAHCEFVKLYRMGQEAIAANYNRDEEEQGKKARWKPEDITEADFEKFLCDGMPMDNGNLRKLSCSTLNKIVNFKRPSRGRLAEVLSRKSDVDRTDLINLSFLLASEGCKAREYKPADVSLDEFVDRTNKILNKCYLGELNFANPFDWCILICMRTDGPLDTYTHIWLEAFQSEVAI